VGLLGRDVHQMHAALRVLDPERSSPLPESPPGPVAIGAEEPAVHAAAVALQRAGLEVISVRPPFMSAAERCFTALRELDTYEDLRPLAERLGPDLRALIAGAPRSHDARAYEEHARGAEQLRAEADRCMAAHPPLLAPVARCELPPRSEAPVSFDDLGPCRAISLLGLPAVTAGGVQIVARPGRDEDALAAAAALERLG
jgi:Asp-tRNA(Asn)/Glu-tRNA(Gln) amidotransferase A subunit family amidase